MSGGFTTDGGDETLSKTDLTSPIEDTRRAIEALKSAGLFNQAPPPPPWRYESIIPYQDSSQKEIEDLEYAEFIMKMWTTCPTILTPEYAVMMPMSLSYFDDEVPLSETVARVKEQLERGPFYTLVCKARERWPLLSAARGA